MRARAGASAEALEDLKALDMAVSGASLEAAIARGQRQAAQAGQRWAQTHQSSVPAKVLHLAAGTQDLAPQALPCMRLPASMPRCMHRPSAA